MAVDEGEYKIRCMKVGGDTLSTYSFSATEGQVVDLVGADAPVQLKTDFWTAANMCEDTGFEIAQKIKSGIWQRVTKREPEMLQLDQ
jgi:hypothetical protein